MFWGVGKDNIMKRVSTTAERLNTIMKERGLKQSDILEKCKPFCDKYGIKMARSDLSQYVLGKNVPRQDKLTALAQALGVEETWLMGYDDEEPTFAALDEDEADLITLYRSFDRRRKHRLMAYLYGLSEDGDEE